MSDTGFPYSGNCIRNNPPIPYLEDASYVRYVVNSDSLYSGHGFNLGLPLCNRRKSVSV